MIHPETQDHRQASQLTRCIKRVRVLADRGQASPPTPSLATSAGQRRSPLRACRRLPISRSDAARDAFSPCVWGERKGWGTNFA